MTLSITFFNVWALLVCFVINMAIGGLWYSPVLFGNAWLKLTGRKAVDITKQEANKAMALAIIPGVLLVVLIWLLINFIGAVTLADALIAGSLISGGFIFVTMVNNALFEDTLFKLILIKTGNYFVALNINAVILMLWK